MKYSTLIRWWCISIVCLPHLTNAQIIQSDRFQFILGSDAASFEATSLEEDGLLLHRTNVKNAEFEIVKLDTTFKQVWNGFIPLERNFTITHKKFHKSNFYVLSHSKNYYDFKLISVDKETGRYTQYNIRNYIPFSPSEFQINDKAAIIGGYFNKIPIVIVFNFETLRIRILPGLFSEIGELTQIKIHEDNSFDVLLCARYFNREKTIWIKSYAPEGDFITQLALPIDGNKSLLFGRMHRSGEDMKIVAGVYGNRNSEFSKGIFISAIDPYGGHQIKYYNFSDLENFFGYLKQRRVERIKGRIEKRKSKGKQTRFNYRLLVHELIPYQNQFVLLGESFYPKYKTVDRASSSGFFMRSSYGYSNDSDLIFDGYRYSHATILGFDINGKLLWDNTFEINDIKTFTLEQFVKFKLDEEKITLLYLFNNQLRTKVIKGATVIEGKETETIKTFENIASIRGSMAELNKLEYWYDKYLLAYGIQNIVTSDQKGDQSEQRVFFVNKLKVK